MKILFVSSFLPYPLYSGGQVRLYNLIRELSAKHEITLICEIRDNQSEKDIREVEKICKKVLIVRRRKQWSVGNLLKTAVSSNSFLLTGHTNKQMKQMIQEEIKKQNFDLLHVETYYVMQNLPHVSIPVVLAEHNIEYQVYRKYADQLSPAIKPLFLPDIVKIKKEEEKYWRKADKVIAVSEDDKRVMKLAGISPSIVANGVDIDKFKFLQRTENKEQRTKKVLFIGDFRWIQNRDSVKFIIEEIWPQISSKFSIRQAQDKQVQSSKFEVKLWIVGRKIPDSIRKLTSDSNVIFDEDSSVRPTEELFHEADLLLAPIRVGGGTSYKIIESMSCGTPVVTTKLSADAIGAKDGEDIICSDDALVLAEKTVELLHNDTLYNKLAKNARALIEKKYTWKKIAKDLEEVYKKVI